MLHQDLFSGAIWNELHWLPIVQRINFKICLLVRNCLVGNGPVYLSEFCNLVSSEAGRRHLRSAARSVLVEPRYRLERYGRRGFSVVGPHLWNLLPLDVRNYEIGHFQKEAKNLSYAAVTNALLRVQSTRGALQVFDILLLLLLLLLLLPLIWFRDLFS